MTEKTNEKNLGDLYTTFQSKKFRDDIAKCVQTKGGKGMEYIPWSNIMDRFIKHCPTMSYEFHEYHLLWCYKIYDLTYIR
jgi:hypothetical protein